MQCDYYDRPNEAVRRAVNDSNVLAPHVDARVYNEDSIFLVEPVSPAAWTWLTDNVGDNVQYFGGNLVVEHRYIGPLVEGMLEDGLVVRGL